MSSPFSLFAVLTTIQPPTPSVLELHRRLVEVNGRLVVAGDRKGPASYGLSDCKFFSLADQRTSGFSLAAHLPEGHYARKNIAYLYAIRSGAECIYETDDDNLPLPDWQVRTESVSGVRHLPVVSNLSWVNVYRQFSSDEQIWPRGFPLERLADSALTCEPILRAVRSPIQQGLANGSPDVDAVWRLTQDRPFDFDKSSSIFLGTDQWCPFNTQSTWWWPLAFPLLYVPSFCSFRMCDIWKSFIAQRCLWALGTGIVFHASEVRQDRNPHNYLRDFQDEVPGYLQNARIAEILSGLSLAEGEARVSENMRSCYAALVAADIFPVAELQLVDAWLSDIVSFAKP